MAGGFGINSLDRQIRHVRNKKRFKTCYISQCAICQCPQCVLKYTSTEATVGARTWSELSQLHTKLKLQLLNSDTEHLCGASLTADYQQSCHELLLIEC